jgi:outer membrane lipoprotein carrier protein
MVLPIMVVASILAETAATGGGNAEALALIERVRAHYAEVESLKAEFTQTYTAGFARDEEKGLVFYKKPAQMYWEYREPTEKHLIANGDKAHFYIPRDKQVLVYNIAGSEDRLFLLFFGGRDPAVDFQIEFETELAPLVSGNHLLRLSPLQVDGFISHLLLEIERKTFKIRRLISVETLGQRNDYVLNNVEENVSISDRRFQFRIPKGVEVIQQDQ